MNIPIQSAKLHFKDGTPLSETYGDVYFSKEDGIAESRYVFLDGNNLGARFAEAHGRFIIAETGFGTGLNFLLTLQLWQEQAPADAWLHYISIEKHPIMREDLARLYATHPCHEGAQAMLVQYPLPVPGAYQLVFLNGRVRLTLIFADIADVLAYIRPASVDAWFLDGFAPSKNPDMWCAGHLHRIGECATAGGTFATFTAAGQVRRDLQEAGFVVTKRPGFGHKREMLTGVMERKNTSSLSIMPSPSEVLVIGAGIAGAAAAHACAMRGMQVEVLERHAGAAMEASGNPAGILYPYMAREWDAATQFYLQGLSYTCSLLHRLKSVQYDLCGMRHYPKLSDDRECLQGVAEALQLDASVLQKTEDGFFMPASGWVDVPGMCRALLEQEDIQTHYHQSVQSIAYEQGQWCVHTEDGLFQASTLIIANAYEAQQLLADHPLPMRRIRGQITYLPTNHVQEEVQEVLCYGGYLTPAIDGVHYLGATFDKEREDLVVDTAGHAENIRTLRHHFPDLLSDMIPIESLEGRAAFRTVSGDRLPIVGALPDCAALQEQLEGMPYSRERMKALQVPLLPNCYVSLAHGARGTVSAPLAGEMIAAAIANEAAHPVNTSVSTLLDPARFALRAWRRGKRW